VKLQKLAQTREVYRANHQTKAQLQRTLRALDDDPEGQERLRKSLEKERSVGVNSIASSVAALPRRCLHAGVATD
jgi:hypothetical protein